MTESWSKADIHMHTTHSDGTARVYEVLAHVARHTDVRVIAITDHDTIEGALEAQQMADAYGIDVIVGEEVSTADGHLLALFIEHELPPRRPAAETIAAVHAQGGLCIAAHPYGMLVPSMGYAGLPQRCIGPEPEWPLDAIEGFNASLWLPRNNKVAAQIGATLGLPLCGGSDSHHLATIGMGYTLFPGHTAADLRRAIQAGQTQAAGISWGWRCVAEFARRRSARWLWAIARRGWGLSPS
ncbi:MAG: PHP domain-containing protein [Chloroflexales bacterium]|nr:PHP domain-containing protein [Chloroflexales bacterium]